MALRRAGQLDDARRAYSAAVRLRPADTTAGDLLGALARGEPPPKLVEERHEPVARLSQFGFGKQVADVG